MEQIKNLNKSFKGINSGREFTKNALVDLFSLEELANKIVIKEDEKLWYKNIKYCWVDWKRVGFYWLRKEKNIYYLLIFWTCNAKWWDFSEEESLLIAYKLNKLDDCKIPNLWKAILLRIVNEIKKSNNKAKELKFTATVYAINKWFYSNTLNLFENNWYIKDYSIIDRDYIVYL